MVYRLSYHYCILIKSIDIYNTNCNKYCCCIFAARNFNLKKAEEMYRKVIQLTAKLFKPKLDIICMQLGY